MRASAGLSIEAGVVVEPRGDAPAAISANASKSCASSSLQEITKNRVRPDDRTRRVLRGLPQQVGEVVIRVMPRSLCTSASEKSLESSSAAVSFSFGGRRLSLLMSTGLVLPKCSKVAMIAPSGSRSIFRWG